MSDESAPPTTSTTGATQGAGTFEQRLAAVHEELRAEEASASKSAGDVSGAAAHPPADAASPSPADSDAEKRAADRRARLEKLKEVTRDAADRREQQKAAEKAQREYLNAIARAEAAEKALQSRLDPDLLKDPARVIRQMGAMGIAPDAVANAIREAIQDPSVGASHAAREAVTPELAAMRKELERTQAALQQMHQQWQAREAHAEEQRQTESFLQLVSQSVDRAPFASRLLAHDRDEFLELATIAAQRVPGGGPEALLDAVEELLDSDVRKVAQKYATIYGPPSTSPAPISPTRAGAKAPTTVSNSAAQERASLLEEESLAQLPLEERARRLKLAM